MAKSHGMNELSGLNVHCQPGYSHIEGDRFGRMFPDLAPLYTSPTVLENLGRLNGAMDGGPSPASTQTVEVGHVFFGQFVDHDITLDVTSSFDRVNDPAEIQNARTPTLDLDCVYGSGPEAMPALYEPSGGFKGVKLITGAEVGGGAHAADDLPRVGPVALIGDPRNDENRIVSQIQLAMIRLHNKFVDHVHAESPSLEGHDLFEAARELTTWHYQWAVVHDFLEKMCGVGGVQRIMSQGRQWYRPKVPFIPVEFSVAGYRFGHSMAPMRIQTRMGGQNHQLFGDTLGRGFSPVPGPEAICEMEELFESHAGRNVQRASRLDTKLAKDLLRLGAPIVGTSEASLATRNLSRGQAFLLPSGENVARAMGRSDAEIADVSAAARTDEPGLVNGTPLWYYILKEAELLGREKAESLMNPGTFMGEPGEGLGPVGAAIVGETIIGLLETDKRSWLSSNRQWRPLTVEIGGNDVSLATVGNLLSWANA